jgi:hypothetical protein
VKAFKLVVMEWAVLSGWRFVAYVPAAESQFAFASRFFQKPTA